MEESALSLAAATGNAPTDQGRWTRKDGPLAGVGANHGGIDSAFHICPGFLG